MRPIPILLALGLLIITGDAYAAGNAPIPRRTLIDNNAGLPPEMRRADIRVQQLTAISFGTFASERGGAITLSPSGMRMATGAVSLLENGQSSPAEFEIIGQPGEIIQIMLPERITLDKDNSQLPVVNLKAMPEGEITLDRTGRTRVRIGGTLQVNGMPISGSYNGFFSLDVRYAN